MFVDGGGWGRPDEPASKPVMTRRQERVILWLLMANVVFMLIAPIGGGTIVEGLVALISHLR